MRDRNEYLCTGQVEHFKRVETATGTPMISFAIKCWRERVQVVAFKSLAEQTTLSPGTRVEVKGFIQNTQWADRDGCRRYGWQVVATEIHIEEGEQQPVTLSRRAGYRAQRQQEPGRQRDCGDNHAYTTGPF